MSVRVRCAMYLGLVRAVPLSAPCRATPDVSRLMALGPVALDEAAQRLAVRDSVERLLWFAGGESVFDGWSPYYVQSRVARVAAAMGGDLTDAPRSWGMAGRLLDEVWQNADFVLARTGTTPGGIPSTLAEVELHWQAADMRGLDGGGDVEAALEERLAVLRDGRRQVLRTQMIGMDRHGQRTVAGEAGQAPVRDLAWTHDDPWSKRGRGGRSVSRPLCRAEASSGSLSYRRAGPAFPITGRRATDLSLP
ncbi:hypothetical protein [Actinoplanes sp. NPDC023714]|uniref:hypothetical protein n=1 Tax=Actinoplanes sp. NPDC023714 TaxID=3154322 RepID=UPI0033E21E0E